MSDCCGITKVCKKCPCQLSWLLSICCNVLFSGQASTRFEPGDLLIRNHGNLVQNSDVKLTGHRALGSEPMA